MERKTLFSPDRVYRYTLWREWPGDFWFDEITKGEPGYGRRDEYVQFIGLNPSTADEKKDDPTVRKCINFAKRWGFGAMCMTNLFAFRATDPKVMKQYPEPVGPDNDKWLVEIAKSSGAIIAAWGTNGVHQGRDAAVKKLIPGMWCLRKTQHGHPEHPCYITYDIELQRFT